MKLGETVHIGGYSGLRFDSNDRATVQECARDLIAQMEPLAMAYPVLKFKIEELRRAYGV